MENLLAVRFPGDDGPLRETQDMALVFQRLIVSDREPKCFQEPDS